MKRKTITTMVAAGAIALGVAGASAGLIHAASSNNAANPMSSLVTAIAKKFNLNAADVQQVFDDQRAQIEAQHQQEYKDRIAQLVTDGKLTQEQADKIVAKQQELQAQREANKDAFANKTEAERRTAMKTEMDALKQWATDNNIPMRYLMFGHGGKGHGGPGFRSVHPDGQQAISAQ